MAKYICHFYKPDRRHDSVSIDFENKTYIEFDSLFLSGKGKSLKGKSRKALTSSLKAFEKQGFSKQRNQAESAR
jgi:hypothetical protein